MIRRALESDFPSTAHNECLVRIWGLRRTYGLNAPFIQYFSDGEGGLMYLMGGVAVLHLADLTEEWKAFLTMNPDIMKIHCDEAIGNSLISTNQWSGRVGDVMMYTGDSPSFADESVCHTPYLPLVYDLLKDHFPGISPFEYWYPDVSHRVRHGHCHISVIKQAEQVVSTAMTVAETEDAVVLGQIATHPDYRRQGLAGKCIKSTISQCKGKLLYILPLNENAQKLYKKLGFVTCGGWAELERTK